MAFQQAMFHASAGGAAAHAAPRAHGSARAPGWVSLAGSHRAPRLSPTGSLRATKLARAGARRQLKCMASGDDETKGAGTTFASPGWLTELGRLWGGKSDIPMADAKFEQIQDLLGGALFTALYQWYTESGPVYLLPTGPLSSFVVVSSPEAAKHVLRSYGSVYEKGLVREVAEFLFGNGFAIADGDLWKGRRKAMTPSLHRAYLAKMVDLVFAESGKHLATKLETAAATGEAVNMEQSFNQLTLDVIGKAVFNYDFNSLNSESPIIQAIYVALKETEQRATDLAPLYKYPLLCAIDPRQRKAAAAVEVIRETTEMLIEKCRKMVEEEELAQGTEVGEEYINESDPSVLRFILASRDEVTTTQLRDDLLSMLVAGHETTGSVLTWTLFLLVNNPDKMAKVHAELDEVLGDRDAPTFSDYPKLGYLMRCINESMRLYPHPPVLLRRAVVEDELPGGFTVPVGQDVMISVYNIHHSPEYWDDPEAFMPERFPLDEKVPDEVNQDYRYIPFSGGQRKCVGDQFALMEAVVGLAVVLKRYDFALQEGQTIGMTTGATIHTTNGLYMTLKERAAAPAKQKAAVSA